MPGFWQEGAWQYLRELEVQHKERIRNIEQNLNEAQPSAQAEIRSQIAHEKKLHKRLLRDAEHFLF